MMQLKRFVVPAFIALSVLFSAQSADAAGLALLKEFKLHDFDTAILQVLGYDAGSILYLREMASISTEEMQARSSYEAIGCNAFYVISDGGVRETGYNCQTFFCVGYSKGPKQCRDRDGKANGGVVEIKSRLEAVVPIPKKVYFWEFPQSQQTDAMKLRISRLDAIRCRPFYLMFWDTAVSEGYECDEVGKFPNFSSENYCVNDWKVGQGYKCEVTIRGDEYDIRLRAIESWGSKPIENSSRASRHSRSSSSLTSTGSSVSSGSSDSTSSMEQSSASSEDVWLLFEDVPSTHASYTAVTKLAERGIISGYPDGTFKPEKTVTRAELLKMILAALRPNDVRTESRCFPDVGSDWYARYVCASKRLNWVSGYVDGFFRPGNTVTRGEAMKMVTVAAGLKGKVALPSDVPTYVWYAPFVRAGIENGIFTDVSFRGTQPLTRADAALWIYRTLIVKDSMEM